MLICSSPLVYILLKEYSTSSQKLSTGYSKPSMDGMSHTISTISSSSSLLARR